MKTGIGKKVLAFLLVLTCLVTAIPLSAGTDAAAAEEVKVEIVSFMRGSQKDLRSSELLEAKVTGYSGNVRNLTYKWTNELGTYLYVYNSQNMYYINNTDGEIEVYNDDIDPSSNMAGRTYKDSFMGVGYCWASVYGASIERTTALTGSITVEVYEGDKLLATDSHEGKVTVSGSWFNRRYSYSGFLLPSLQVDMDHVTIGIFEGDKRNVKDLLGESAILHITCEESNVSKGSIAEGKDHIKLTTESGDYYITGTDAGSSTTGDAKVNLTISKGNCKFHHSGSATAVTTVFVFPKPTTATTTSTLTLTGNLDDRCEYFVAGVKGERAKVNGVETITFTGLNPNTEYAVEVHAHYTDATTKEPRVAYAYVYDTTKPIYNGTVEVLLNGSYDTSTATATGTRVDIKDMINGSDGIFVKEASGQAFIKLPNAKDTDGNDITGVYSSTLETGTYYIYSDEKDSALIDSQALIMSGADRTRYVFFNSVQYLDGNENLGIDYADLGTDYYVTGSPAVTRSAPEREGLVFTGWKDENGNIYPAGSVFAEDIYKPYVLTAQWEKGVNVFVNVTVDHYHNKSESYYNGDDRHFVSFDLMSRNDSSVDFEDVVSPVEINWDGEDGSFDNKDFSLSTESDNEGNILKTIYTAENPVLANVRKGSEYSVEVTKHGYELISVNSTTDSEGNVTLDVLVEFDPKNADLKFTVELDEAAKTLVQKYPEYKPVAVHVKVLSWYEKGYTKHGHTIPDNSWAHISQHHDTYVTLNFADGYTAEGSYPVWMHYNGRPEEPFYYRIKVVSYVLSDGTTIYTSDVENQQDVQYISDGERYLATISVTDADDLNIPSRQTELYGAYFTPATDTTPIIQNGTPKASISIRTHSVKFNPDGGVLKVQGDDTQYTVENQLLLKEQIKVPELGAYVPAREGGYIFEGWYLADENGNITSKQVFGGDELTEDIILIAKWKDPITVEGTIAVDTMFTVDDRVIEIFDHDRVKSLNVILQRTLHNGYTETVQHKVVPITYTKGASEGFGAYEFTGVPNDSQHPYRISIISTNYAAVYQNEPQSLIEPLNYGSYTLDAYNAVLGEVEPEVANVNAYLHYEPLTFPLQYQINAAAIGEGFRPKKADTLILCDNDTNIAVNPQRWDVIGQMVMDDNTYMGQKTDIPSDTAIGENSYPAWANEADGVTLYDYAIRLNGYVPYNGNDFETVDEKTIPFYINYNGTARYSAIYGQTQVLTANLVPKLYTVTLDINCEETEQDYVYNLDNVGEDENGYYIYHTWSFDTPVSAEPLRKGYMFMGWFDKDGNQVTVIDASVCENMTLTAKWEKLFEVRFHANNEAVSEDIFRTYYQQGNLAEDKLTLESDGRIKAFYDLPKLSYLDNNKYIFKGWYFDKDNDNDTNPINWETTTYSADTDVYAHWIIVGEVEKHADDKKDFMYPKEGIYPEFDLAGVQIRSVQADETDHYGKAGTGLRFLTILSDNVYNQINAISPANKGGAEYGFAVAKTSTAEKYSKGQADYELQYKGDNVNGVNTSEDYHYVVNMKCSGVSDHKYYKGSYRIYTAVITYDGIEGDALTEAQNSPLTARSYMRYNDANGLYRTYYNNYTGTNSFSGCSASYSAVSQSIGLAE